MRNPFLGLRFQHGSVEKRRNVLSSAVLGIILFKITKRSITSMISGTWSKRELELACDAAKK